MGYELVAVKHGSDLKGNDFERTLLTFPFNLIEFAFNVLDLAQAFNPKGLEKLTTDCAMRVINYLLEHQYLVFRRRRK